MLTRGGKQNYYLKALLYGMAISFLIFIPFIIFDNGYFLFYGDYNVQQVPFYQMCHDAVRSGNIGWSWTTDLGANFIGSYSFYLLGSPFFWLTIPFPSWMVPHLMGPLLILKFGCASLTGFLYLKRYVKNPDYAVIGGMLYAFSGFSVYNIFFNHFHEAIVFFPLMLWALDEYMYHRRRGVFAFTVFLCCTVNYYFFVGQVVFTLIYWFVRMLAGSWAISLRDFLLLVCEAVLGVLGSCFLLVPTVLAIIQNPRLNDAPNGWNALLYENNQRYVHILECFFFPPDIPARPNFTPNSEAKLASLGAWFPLFGMTGVIGFLQSRRKHWLKTLICLLFLMAFVPVLNAAFQLFNMAYYARWFYMLTLMMSLATVTSLQYGGVDWKRAVKWTLGITLGIALPIGLMPRTVDGAEKSTVYGLEDYPTRFWPYVAIALLSIALLVLIFQYYKRDRKKFLRSCTAGIALITVVYASYFIALGKTQGDDSHNWVIPHAIDGKANISLPDTTNCRVDVFDGMDNQAMFWRLPTIQAFQSTVSNSILEFYPTVGVTRDVASRPQIALSGLRPFLSVKYLFDADNSATIPSPGWVVDSYQLGFKVWRNTNYIPMGYTFDYYVSQSGYELCGSKDKMLLKALVLSRSQIAKYSDILTELPESQALDFSDTTMSQDCTNRRDSACSSFRTDNYGFTSKITLDKDNLVFFSVPYDSGWSATVNGKPADIEKVDIGFMAVKCGYGDNTIRFTYKTPGLNAGLALTGSSAAALVIYLLVSNSLRRKKVIVAQEDLTNANSEQKGLPSDYDNHPDGDEG